MNEGLAEISKSSFFGCSRIQTIRLPANITYIGDMAFGGCDSLTDVFYCGVRYVMWDGDPFPANVCIYVLDSFQEDTFCGREYVRTFDCSPVSTTEFVEPKVSLQIYVDVFVLLITS